MPDNNTLVVSFDFGYSGIKILYNLGDKPMRFLTFPTMVTPIQKNLADVYQTSYATVKYPENAAWVAMKEEDGQEAEYFAVGDLAEVGGVIQGFKQDKTLNIRLFLQAGIGAIAELEMIDSFDEIKLKLMMLLPKDLLKGDIYEKVARTALRRFVFRGKELECEIEEIKFAAEGEGLLRAGRYGSKDKKPLRFKRVGGVMIGCRDMTFLLCDRGTPHKPIVRPLGMGSMIDTLVQTTSFKMDKDMYRVLWEIKEEERKKTPDGERIKMLVAKLVPGTRFDNERNLLIEDMTQSLAAAKKQYVNLLLDFIGNEIGPKDLDELVIGGGTALYLSEEINEAREAGKFGDNRKMKILTATRVENIFNTLIGRETVSNMGMSYRVVDLFYCHAGFTGKGMAKMEEEALRKVEESKKGRLTNKEGEKKAKGNKKRTAKVEPSKKPVSNGNGKAVIEHPADAVISSIEG